MLQTRLPGTLRFHGDTGRLADNIARHWLIGLREANPAILAMFRDRDVPPYRDMLPWSGEFAGKYLTSAHAIYRITGDAALRRYVEGFLEELLTCQDEDGYLGCYQRDCRLTGACSQNPQETGITWDAWAHYHLMIGLLLWYEETECGAYLRAAERIAGLFLSRFYDGRPPLSSIGSTEMNLAVYHGFARLYEVTHDPRYLSFARRVEADFAEEAYGNYIGFALEGRPFYQNPKPRWESLHVVMGIAAMYRLTGEERYRTAASQIVHSILETDVHNTGAFSTDEGAMGHPYRNGNIETCCVVAFNALVCDLLAITGEAALADFLEQAHYNAVLGYNAPSGHWCTYSTPMDGVRRASFDTLQFQSRPGSPQLNCCSVNAPRGVGAIGDWALLDDGAAVYLNSYEALTAKADGLSITVTSDYPCDNRVQVHVDSHGAQRTLRLRIPGWSAHTRVELGGELVTPPAGTYLSLQRVWDDTITLVFDYRPRTQAGALDYAGLSSVYVGPVLYAFDNGRNPTLPFPDVPPIPRGELASAVPERAADGSMRLALSGGVVLTDFYHAGDSGSAYKTWLPVG